MKKSKFIRFIAPLLVLCLLGDPAFAFGLHSPSPLLPSKAQSSPLFEAQAIDPRLAGARFYSADFQSHPFVRTVREFFSFIFKFPQMVPVLADGFPVIPDRVERAAGSAATSYWQRLHHKFSKSDAIRGAATASQLWRKLNVEKVKQAIQESDEFLRKQDITQMDVQFDTTERLVGLLTKSRIKDTRTAVLLVINRSRIQSEEVTKQLKKIWAKAGIETVMTIHVALYEDYQRLVESNKMPSSIESLFPRAAPPEAPEESKGNSNLREVIQPLDLPWEIPTNLLEFLNLWHLENDPEKLVFHAGRLLLALWTLCDKTKESSELAAGLLLRFASEGILKSDVMITVNGRAMDEYDETPIPLDATVNLDRRVTPVKAKPETLIPSKAIHPALPEPAPVRKSSHGSNVTKGLDYFDYTYFRHLLRETVYAEKYSQVELFSHDLSHRLSNWPAVVRFDQLMAPRGPDFVIDSFLQLCGYVKGVHQNISPEIRESIASADSPSALFHAGAAWLEAELEFLQGLPRSKQDQRLKEALRLAGVQAPHLPLFPTAATESAKKERVKRFERIINDLKQAFSIEMDPESLLKMGDARTIEKMAAIIRDLVQRRLVAVRAYRGTTPAVKVEPPATLNQLASLPVSTAAPEPVVEEASTAKEGETDQEEVRAPELLLKRAEIGAIPAPAHKTTAEKSVVPEIEIEPVQPNQQFSDFGRQWETLKMEAETAHSLRHVARLLDRTKKLDSDTRAVSQEFVEQAEQVHAILESRSRALQEIYAAQTSHVAHVVTYAKPEVPNRRHSRLEKKQTKAVSSPVLKPTKRIEYPDRPANRPVEPAQVSEGDHELQEALTTLSNPPSLIRRIARRIIALFSSGNLSMMALAYVPVDHGLGAPAIGNHALAEMILTGMMIAGFARVVAELFKHAEEPVLQSPRQLEAAS